MSQDPDPVKRVLLRETHVRTLISLASFFAKQNRATKPQLVTVVEEVVAEVRQAWDVGWPVEPSMEDVRS